MNASPVSNPYFTPATTTPVYKAQLQNLNQSQLQLQNETNSMPAQANYSAQPTYQSQASYPDQTTYPAQSSYTARTSYSSQPSYSDQSSYLNQANCTAQNTYSAQASYPSQADHLSQGDYPNQTSYPLHTQQTIGYPIPAQSAYSPPSFGGSSTSSSSIGTPSPVLNSSIVNNESLFAPSLDAGITGYGSVITETPEKGQKADQQGAGLRA